MFPKIGNFSNSAYYSKPSSQIFNNSAAVYPHHGKVYALPRPYYYQYPNPNSSQKSYYLEKTDRVKEKALERKLLLAKIRQIAIEKEKVRDEIYKLYNIHISNYELRRLSYEELLTKVVRIHQKFKENTAALIIQQAWKNFILRKDPNYNKRIQLARRLAKINMKKYSKEEAALVIQRIYRGFKVRQEFMMVRGRFRIHKNLDYFEEVKNKLKKDSARTIWKHWSVYRQNKVLFIQKNLITANDPKTKRLNHEQLTHQAKEPSKPLSKTTIPIKNPSPSIESNIKKSCTLPEPSQTLTAK